MAGGTLPDRLGSTINFLPEGIRNRIKAGVADTVAFGSKTVDATAGNLKRVMVSEDGTDMAGPPPIFTNIPLCAS